MDEFQINSHNPRDYEETDNTDWQALRNQYAGLAMQALLSIGHSTTFEGDMILSDDSILSQKAAAHFAVKYADALIEELKKK